MFWQCSYRVIPKNSIAQTVSYIFELLKLNRIMNNYVEKLESNISAVRFCNNSLSDVSWSWDACKAGLHRRLEHVCSWISIVQISTVSKIDWQMQCPLKWKLRGIRIMGRHTGFETCYLQMLDRHKAKVFAISPAAANIFCNCRVVSDCIIKTSRYQFKRTIRKR